MVATKLTSAVIICLLFIIGLAIIYFSKERLKNEENRLYKLLLIANIVGLVFHLLSDIVSYNFDTIPLWLSSFILKTYAIYFLTYGLLLLYYLCIIANLKHRKLYRLMMIGTDIITYIILYFLPQHVYRDLANNIFYTDGLDVRVIYILSGVVATLIVAIIIKKINRFDKSKAIPLFVFVCGGIASIIIQKYDPGIVIIDCIESIIILLMYFTIENPDLKMLQELANNRKLTESSIEEKSNLLFQVSQEVKNPLMQITDLSNEILKSNDVASIHATADKIDMVSRNVTGVINNVLDITTLDKQNIKIANSSYNVYTLLKEIIYVTKNKYRNENNDIDFKYSISNNIPEYLYGDALKIKQVVCSVLFNAFNNTESGFVDIDVTNIVKYDVCRLVITISDSGKGLDLQNVNEILKTSDSISDEELKRIDSLDVNLKLVKKIIDILGGSILVKSEINVGTTITIILNQEIATTSGNEIKTIADKLSNKKRVLLIDNNYLELDHYAYELRHHNLEVISTMYGEDCIEKLRNGETFDLILVDDELYNSSAIQVLKAINDLKIKNQKVVIMLDQKKEFMKDKFLRDYNFTDYLLKSEYQNEMERVTSKYL